LPYVREHFWHPSARFEEKDGVTRLHLDVATGVDLENWILGMADRVVVRAPAALRERIRGRLLAALAAYDA
jgi:predicted DNA-binding transcriptional regulator YafY